ncbi:unnamed protein product, partial [Coregonus sp. 'balchen']
RGGRQGHWRRRQHHWNGPDHFHNDNRSPVFQQDDGYACPVGFRVGPWPFPPVGRHTGHTGALDELTLKHMAQDCSSVKNQLLTLKSLLQDGEEDNSITLQLEDLMKEVQELREELRNKERTITQLTLQQQQLQQQGPAHAAKPGRCHCHQRAPSLGGDRRTHHDKATQTSWRGQGHSQAFKGLLEQPTWIFFEEVGEEQNGCSVLETLNWTGLLPAPFLSPWQSQYQGPPRTSMPQRRRSESLTQPPSDPPSTPSTYPSVSLSASIIPSLTPFS